MPGGGALTGALSRSARHRVLTRAARAWDSSRPHQAMEILADAGMIDYWPELMDQLLKRARERTVRLLAP